MGRKPCGRHPPELRVYRTARVPRRRGTSTEAPGHPDGLSRTLISRHYLGNRAPAKNRSAPNRGVVLLCSGPCRTVELLGDGPASRRMNGLVQQLPASLLQPVLLERTHATEKLHISGRLAAVPDSSSKTLSSFTAPPSACPHIPYTKMPEDNPRRLIEVLGAPPMPSVYHALAHISRAPLHPRQATSPTHLDKDTYFFSAPYGRSSFAVHRQSLCRSPTASPDARHALSYPSQALPRARTPAGMSWGSIAENPTMTWFWGVGHPCQ